MGEVAPGRRRMGGAALRRYREQRGLSLDDAARLLGCDRSKISRIENGLRGVRERDLDGLLAEYGASAGERAGLLMLAGPRSGEGWWQAYAGVLPAAAVEYAGLEAAASRLLVYEPQRVPALARTGGYCRLIAGHDPALAAGTADAAEQFTVLRQRAVLDSGRKELVMVIGEAALRQRAGGTGIMRAQLERLAGLGRQEAPPAVHVLPFASGAHAFRAVNATVFEQLAERGHPAVRPSHAVVFMNLDPDGTKMVTLAQRAGITRQAMSKLIHDLQASGYVEVRPDPDDGRATRVLLTGRGIAFCAEVGNVISELEQRWRQLLGVDRPCLNSQRGCAPEERRVSLIET